MHRQEPAEIAKDAKEDRKFILLCDRGVVCVLCGAF
jgi:hypothetical protein